jgi:hypothetical protein
MAIIFYTIKTGIEVTQITKWRHLKFDLSDVLTIVNEFKRLSFINSSLTDETPVILRIKSHL